MKWDAQIVWTAILELKAAMVRGRERRTKGGEGMADGGMAERGREEKRWR